MSQPEPLTEQQLDEYETAARNAARIGSGIDPAAVLELAAEVRRQREKHKASLRRVDQVNNELMEEVQRYAAGTERPVLWSVYNDMHLRAADAELTLDRVRRIARRLAAHAVGFGDVPDDSDRGPWAKTVGADIAELSAAVAPEAASEATSAPLSASQGPEVPTEPETATEAPEGLLRLSADRVRALAILEAADFLRDAHRRDGLTVQEIGTALRNTADEADPMVGSLARDGFGLDEIADMLGSEVTPGAHPIADADNPTPLRWGLDDVLWGDDDSITVLLSGPDLEPYRLELDPERAAVLRRNLAGPDGEETSRIAITRSDLAALLAHHADVLAARWRAVAPGAGAWEVAAALSLTSHANDLTAEMKRPTVTELLDNIWTFNLEQQAAAEEATR